LPYSATAPLPPSVEEHLFAGFLNGRGIELVKCKTIDLEVPANAEIVIEGHVDHTDTSEEGPMGEYPGYLDRSTALPRPVLHVSAVTYRDQAILPVAVAGAPVEEDHTGWGMPHAAEMTYVLRQANLPVAACWGVLESANHWWVVAVHPDWHERTGLSSHDLAQRVGETVFGAGKLAFGVPKLLLIENDIDIADPRQVIWAFASRGHPEHGEVHFEREPQNILPIYLDSHEQLSYQATKVVYNCLIADRFAPDERPVPSDFAHAWPADIRQHVLANWQAYGYR